MWINREIMKPTYSGAYNVYGIVNRGTEHETKCKFVAYWDSEIEEFTDKDGDDLIGIDDGIKFWFDFTQIPDPVWLWI